MNRRLNHLDKSVPRCPTVVIRAGGAPMTNMSIGQTKVWDAKLVRASLPSQLIACFSESNVLPSPHLSHKFGIFENAANIYTPRRSAHFRKLRLHDPGLGWTCCSETLRSILGSAANPPGFPCAGFVSCGLCFSAWPNSVSPDCVLKQIPEAGWLNTCPPTLRVWKPGWSRDKV